MKTLIAFLALIFIAVGQQVGIRPFNNDRKSWTGYNPVCRDQCSA